MVADRQFDSFIKTFLPFLLPGQGQEEGQHDESDMFRYATRLLDSGLRPTRYSVLEAESQLKTIAGRQGSDVGSLAAKLAQLEAILGPEDRAALLNTLVAVAEHGGSLRSSHASRLRESLTDATNSVAPFATGHVSQPQSIHFSENLRGAVRMEGDAPADIAGPTAAVAHHVLKGPHSLLLEHNEELVQDILHVCQGLNGRLIILKNASDQSFHLTDSVAKHLSDAQKSILMQLCELGWQYRRVTQLVGGPAQGMGLKQSGLLQQAFSAAIVQHELKEFYRLMAMLQALSLRPVAAEDNNYLTPRRLLMWLLDPLRRMRVLANLAESCQHKQGGQCASVIYAQTLSGDLFRKGYATRILRHVCVPLHGLVHRWITEGELNDPFGDFFIVAKDAERTKPDFDLWRDGYELCQSLVPSFIDSTLAGQILRAGKSINFLRESCDDLAWVQNHAAEAQMSRSELPRLEQGHAMQTHELVSALRQLVRNSCAAVDERLKHIMLVKYGFLRHCVALKQLLFFAQGDFISALLHQLQKFLPRKAQEVSILELTDCLKKAIDASNAKFQSDDVQDRLAIKKQDTPSRNEKLANVVMLQYNVRAPLLSLLTSDSMQRYQQISTFLFKLKRLEFNLQLAWLVLRRVERLLQRTLRPTISLKHGLWMLLRKAHRLHSDMSSFCQNLQTYVTCEVLEGAWSTFEAAVTKADEVDQIKASHEAYLDHIEQQALLDSRTYKVRETLQRIFDCCDSLLHPLKECESHVAAKAALLRQVEANVSAGQWGARENPAPQLIKELAGVANSGMQELSRVEEAYSTEIHAFTEAHASDVTHLDLDFLMMRINFTEMYQAPPAKSQCAAKA